MATTDAGERTYLCARFDPSSGLLATACSYQGGGMVRIDKISEGELIPVTELWRSDTRTHGKCFVDTLVRLDFSPDWWVVGPVRDIRHLPRCTAQRMAGRCCALRDRDVEGAMEGIGRCQGDRRQAVACEGGSRDGIPHGSPVLERRDPGMRGDPLDTFFSSMS